LLLDNSFSLQAQKFSGSHLAQGHLEQVFVQSFSKHEQWKIVPLGILIAKELFPSHF